VRCGVNTDVGGVWGDMVKDLVVSSPLGRRTCILSGRGSDKMEMDLYSLHTSLVKRSESGILRLNHSSSLAG